MTCDAGRRAAAGWHGPMPWSGEALKSSLDAEEEERQQDGTSHSPGQL